MKTICYTLIIIILCLSCRAKQKSILPEKVRLKTGDLVLRRGYGLMSRAVTAVDNGCEYSHIGIVVDSCGVPMIAHAVTGEPDFEGDKDRVKLDNPDCFFAEDHASAGCILRCKDTIAARAAARKALELYKRGLLFDHFYNIQDSTRMYCCEFIEYTYTAANFPLTNGKYHDVYLPGLTLRKIILPSDFLKSSMVRCISRF